MAADQERAERIRALKQSRPDLTWRRIADFVGVTERSATDWQTKGGIEYDNAKKLAELFKVDVDYVWRGPSDKDRAPSPFGAQDALEDRLSALETLVHETLKTQTELLGRILTAVERVEDGLDQEEDPAKWAARLEAMVRQVPEASQPAAETQESVPDRRAKRKSPQG